MAVWVYSLTSFEFFIPVRLIPLALGEVVEGCPSLKDLGLVAFLLKDLEISADNVGMLGVEMPGSLEAGERVALPMREALSNTAVRDLWSEWGKGVDPNSSMINIRTQPAPNRENHLDQQINARLPTIERPRQHKNSNLPPQSREATA